MDSQDNLTRTLCAKGCGFFGSPENKNLCSKCYKDYPKEEVIAKTANKLSELVITRHLVIRTKLLFQMKQLQQPLLLHPLQL
jgi:hypothetical protein